ncbi:MAG: hypothetical protein JW809_13995 [Pirellulales bacterium]|nr:hypothetical protein [Pirellulales bacterium]
MVELRPLAAVLWVAPWTAVGLAVGAIGLATGGRARWRDGAIEFHGGAVAGILGRLPVGPMAMTLGHVILGRTAAALDLAGRHERVHVRQYERWGPAMAPLYLFYSARLWLAGKDPYRDNPFEQDAYEQADAVHQPPRQSSR